MAIGIEEVNASIQTFNEKYKFTQKAEDYIDIFTTQKDYNYMYVSTLEWMVGEVSKRIDQLKDFEVHQMVADFEQYVMSNIRRYAEENELYPASEAATHPGRIPDYLAGMTEKDILGRLDQKLAGMEWEKVDDIAKDYMAGELPIREMRKFSKSLILSNGEENLKFARQIAGFSAALTRANESRSFFWALTHPVRFFAERRYAGQFKKLIEDNMALEENFEHYLDEFKQAPEHISLMRKQIDARINDPEKSQNFVINSEKQANDLNANNKADKINNNEIDLKNANNIISDNEVDEKAPPLGFDETAMARFEQTYAANENFLTNVIGEINNQISNYAKGHPDTYGRIPEVYVFQMIEGGVRSACGENVGAICEEYDNYLSNVISDKELNDSTKENIEKMFGNIMGALAAVNLPLKNKLVMTQNAIDKILNKFSPAAYDPDTIGRFANKFMIREDSEFVKNYLETNMERSKNGRPVTAEEKQEIANAIDGAREELGLRINIGDSIDLNESTNENIIGKIDDNSLEIGKQINNGNII